MSALDLITQQLQQQQQQKNNNRNSNDTTDKYCLFFDESRGIECDVSLSFLSLFRFFFVPLRG